MDPNPRTGPPVQTAGAQHSPGGPKHNSLGIVLGYPTGRLGTCGLVSGAQCKPAGGQYFPGGPQNNSECALGIVLGYQRGVLDTRGLVLGRPTSGQYSPGAPKPTLTAPLGQYREVLGTCGFALGAQYKPAGAQYSPGGPKNNSERALGIALG